ncbi:hypothetical protein F4809DRAFT_663788 [Biscogniauxia mediterranea]|nr:hypothetical protein F4809DRAFT_663788 [Biscogniauxia mediterranea]
MVAEQTRKRLPSAGNIVEELGLKDFATICSIKALRGAPKLLPKVAVGGVSFLLLTYLWLLYLAGGSLRPNYFEVNTWRPATAEEVAREAGGGLRVVVFGGGDVATPNRFPRQPEGDTTTWTEVMCQELGCDSHISLVPSTDTPGGAIVSNSLFETALDRLSVGEPIGDDPSPELDYSWVREHYPTPSHPDLASQVNSFLAMPRPRIPPRETLWVFNFGFWDIWGLAAMPRRLAMDVIDSQAQHLFSYVEHLYNSAQNNASIAFSNHHRRARANNHNHDLPLPQPQPQPATPAPSTRPLFKILVPTLFDITLAPGFARSRRPPPAPHPASAHLRNAAFLARYWDAALRAHTGAWLALPDPAAWAAGPGQDLLDADTAVVKRAAAVVPGTRRSRRDALVSDAGARYLRGVVAEGQLRGGASVGDRGDGVVGPHGDGEGGGGGSFAKVRRPCVVGESKGREKGDGDGDGEEDGGGGGHEIRDANAAAAAADDDSVSASCDAHLFWTEFTVGPRAVAEVGRRAAEQIKKDARWWAEEEEEEEEAGRDGVVDVGGTGEED